MTYVTIYRMVNQFCFICFSYLIYISYLNITIGLFFFLSTKTTMDVKITDPIFSSPSMKKKKFRISLLSNQTLNNRLSILYVVQTNKKKNQRRRANRFKFSSPDERKVLAFLSSGKPSNSTTV